MTRKIPLVIAALALGGLAIAIAGGAGEWIAPARAAARKNPVAANETSVALGKDVYERLCLACHGARGQGDGPAVAHLEASPGNLADPALWKQSDGVLLWKITEGHTPMPMFKNVTSDEERWPLVNYIRTFAPRPAASRQPTAEKTEP